MIDVHIKSKNYRARDGKSGQTVIDDLQFKVENAEFACLVGPSGCGKTTLLNIIAGLDADFDGAVTLDAAHPAKIGYVYQNPRLLPWRTVRENIELAFEDKPEEREIDWLLEYMQLTPFQHTYPERLSLGMSRRAAIIRAFAINPDILLMDEPFVSLDLSTAKQVRALLVKLWRQRPHTVLFVTHDLREAIALADRLIFLSSSPMRLIEDIPVKLTSDERENETIVESFRQNLLPLMENQVK